MDKILKGSLLMYLHLGQDTVVKMCEIVAVFDLETSTISKKTRDYLANAQKQGRVVNVSMELPKTFVLCQDSRRNTVVYISQLSSSTLLKRTAHFSHLANTSIL